MNIQKFIPNAVTSKLGRQILQVQKHSPVLMFATGVVGIIGTTVLACRATLKLEEVLEATQVDLAKAKIVLDEERLEYSKQDYTRDVALVRVRTAVNIGKLYAPAMVLGTVSIGCLTGAHLVLTKRNVALTAAYSAIQKGFSEYRDRVIKEVGADKERELRYDSETHEYVEETDEGPQVKRVERVSPAAKSVYARFFDECTPNWKRQPEYNHLFIQCQQNYANDLLRSRGHVFLNEVYDMLGIDRSKAGAVVGWVLSKDGDNFIDFGVFDGDNQKARDFVNGREGAILLDFNVDGVIFDKI